jgi:hypothetical protein
MKKLFAVLLTLCLVFSLPLFVMAEEATTAPETVEEATTAPETVEETAPVETTAPAETESAPENETEAETEYQMNLGFYPETLLDTLPVMGMGMLGIFLVTCVIVLAVVVLSKLGGKNQEE